VEIGNTHSDRFQSRRVRSAPARLSFGIYKYILITLFIILSFLLRFAVTLNKEFVPDEFQHVQASWLISEGLVPYKDFWENHTPLYHFILAASFKLLPETPKAIISLRLLQFLPVLLIFFMVNLFIQTRYDFTVFLYSLLLLGFHKWFLDKTCEVRPDVILVLFSLVALYFWIFGWDFFKGSHLFTSGIFIGLSFITSPKVLILLFSMLFSFIIHLKISGKVIAYKKIPSLFLLFLSGVLIPILILILYLIRYDAFGQFQECLWLGIFKNPNRFSPASFLRKSFLINLVFWVTGLVGLVYYSKKYLTGKRNSIFHLTIIFTIICNYIAFHWFMPAPYPQSALLIFPLLSIYASLILYLIEENIRKKLQGLTRFFLFLVVFLIIVTPPFLSYIISDDLLEKRNEKQKERIEFILANTDADARIFDCQGFYMFRKPATYYGVLVKGVLLAMGEGIIKYDLKDDLVKNNCSMAIPDYRWSMLPDDILQFLEENFVLIPKYDILVPGKIIEGRGIKEDVNFELPIDIPYALFTVPPLHSGQIDGGYRRLPVYVPKGPHKATITEEVDKIIVLPEYTRKGDFDILIGEDVSKAEFRKDP